MGKDVKLILLVAVPSLLILTIFYKEIKLFVFDETYAKTIGLNTWVINGIILVVEKYY